jgi:prolyl-tRNA editing enzyme YbaK/EbsC (Cys-tRNA(Pro) deacylase)
MLDQTHLRKYLLDNGIKAELIEFESPVLKSEQAEGLVKGNVVKSILLLVDGEPLLCLLKGEDRLSFSKLRKLLGVKQLRLGKAKEVKRITGYDIGALPPFAHLTRLKTLLDVRVSKLKEDVFVGGGSHYHLMRIGLKELLNVTRGEVVDIHE